MQLYFSPSSPYARKVRILIAETGVKVEQINTAAKENIPALISKNPLGRVPTLVLDDGSALFDSPVITEYLDSINLGRKLLPPTGPDRWTILKRQALGDGFLDDALPRRHESIRPANEQSPGFLKKCQIKMARTLDYLETVSGELTGFDIGIISIGCALGYSDFRFPDDQWRVGRPKLANWFRKLGERPSFAETRPPT